MAKNTIVLVDPCSSRINFIDEITKAGCVPICVFPHHDYEDTFESMQYKNEVSTIMSICKEKSAVIEAPENLDEVVSLLGAYEILAVINCSDDATQISDVLAEKLGCPLNPSATSNVRVDKADMQEAVAKKGLRSVRTQVINSEDDIKKFINANPVKDFIVKPARSGGLKGVYPCETVSDALAAFFSLKNESNAVGEKNKKIIIQERIRGIHYFFNTVSVDGNHRVTQTWVVEDKIVGKDLMSITYTSLPKHPPGFRNITKYALEVLDALEFRNGVAQTEVMIDRNGPVLMEINPRMMKFYVAPEVQDMIFGNHNSDVAMMALTDPEKFLNTWATEPEDKSFIIKHLISTVEGPRYAKPAEMLISLIDGVVKIGMNVPMDKIVDFKRTTDALLHPGSVQIFNKDPLVLMNTVMYIDILQLRYPDLLWDTVEKHDSCGFISDINEISSEIKGKTVAIMNDASTLEWKDGKYASADENKKYSCGVIVLGGQYRLDDRYFKIKAFYDMIKEGGTIYALRSSYENMPYKDSGLEAILALFGASVDVPKTSTDDVIKCTVHH